MMLDRKEFLRSKFPTNDEKKILGWTKDFDSGALFPLWRITQATASAKNDDNVERKARHQQPLPFLWFFNAGNTLL